MRRHCPNCGAAETMADRFDRFCPCCDYDFRFTVVMIDGAPELFSYPAPGAVETAANAGGGEQPPARSRGREQRA